MAKGAVAAGHSETAKAAEEVLHDGGNAFDAVVAAHLAACVAEPVLTSLGGGGFLLAKTADDKETIYDFFAQTPSQRNPEPHFFPISADFGTVQQEFHIGAGSMAVPGTVKGVFAIHKDLGTLPMKRLVEPAVKLARIGLQMNAFQSRVLDVVKPIYLKYPEAKNTFASPDIPGQLVQEGNLLKQPLMADLLEAIAVEGDDLFYNGDMAKKTASICKEEGGHLTEADFRNYRVIKRKPLVVGYRNCRLCINPPPCSGGILVAFALKLLEELPVQKQGFESVEYLNLLAEIQGLTEKAKADAFVEGEDEANILDPSYLEEYASEVMGKFPALRGTTHISIVDRDGNMASLSTSNGEGCGIMIPGTGVMMNNMLGEEDINPKGFGKWPLNERMTSMMAPGILEMGNGRKIAFGSGGSNRIRTAILQLLVNLADFGMSPQEAVRSPRIHYERGLLNIEHGFDLNVVEALCKKFRNHRVWDRKDLFFGGTHVVSIDPGGYSGFGDPRRGGVSVIVN